jgi:predicted metal-dependent HD superfamily phosphohydrolase
MPHAERWQSTWKGLGIEDVEANDPLYRDVVRRYSEPHRRYHSLQHLDECFVRLDEAAGLAERIHEVELALWFHDVVYDPRSRDNEGQSAAIARAAIGSKLPVAVTDRVQRLILATKHDDAPATPDAALLVDIDLWILAAPAERFDEYERQVREEYAWVPEFLFRPERRRILESFLRRPAIYSTERFHACCEAQARANLDRSILSLAR